MMVDKSIRTTRLREQLDVLFDISRALHQTVCMEDLCHAIHQSLKSILNFTGFAAALFDPDQKALTLPYCHTIFESPGWQPVCFPEVIRTENPVLLSQTDIHRIAATLPCQPPDCPPPATWLGIPLKHAGRLVGAFAIQNDYHPIPIEPADMDFLVRVADLTAIGISKNIPINGDRYNEAFLRKIFDVCPTGIVLNDMETHGFVAANPAFLTMLGYSQEELNRLKIKDITHPDDWESEQTLIQKKQEDKSTIFRIKKRLIRKDGAVCWVKVTGELFEMDSAKPYALVSVEDITELELAGNGLRESEERFHRLTDSAFIGIVIHDNGTILDCNHTISQMFGYSRQEMIGKNILLLFSTESPNPDVDYLHMKYEKPYEINLFNKDGRVLTMEAVGKPVLHSGKNATVLALWDITERRKATTILEEKEKHLMKLAKRLKDTNTAMKVILENREMEIKELQEGILSNVNNAIIPYLEKMSNNNMNEINQAYLKIIKRKLNQLISPFQQSSFLKAQSLTPMEISIADFIKIGKSSKEIADLMNVSSRTIEFHRNNIRKKLGLQNTGSNLTTYLMSLP
jgi:PAS domain S-box-containing protein